MRLAAGLAVLLLCFGVAPRAADAECSLPKNRRYAIQQMGDSVGLSTRAPVALLQDQHGFIWLGAQDGLVRFDGVSAVNYGKREGLPSAYVEQLLEGPTGRLWIATMSGIVSFDGVTFSAVAAADEPLAKQRGPVLQRMALDARGRLYVATVEGLIRFDPPDRSRARAWSKKDGLPASHIEAVHAATDGQIWLAAGHRLASVDPESGSLALLPGSAGIPDEPIQAILSDEKRRLWVRTENHLLRRDRGAKTFAYDDDGLPSTVPGWAVPALVRGSSLVVPTTQGVCLRREQQWECVGEAQGLQGSSIRAAIEDREGALWLGLTGFGVGRWPWRRGWSAWTTAEGLPSNMVWGIVRDRQDRLWLGTDDGVAIWDPAQDRWHVRRKKDGVAGSAISTFALDGAGAMWAVSFRSGLTRFDPDTLEPNKVALPDGYAALPTSIAAAQDGTIWIGSFEYLITARASDDGVAFEPVSGASSEAQGFTRNVAIAPDGVVWTSGPRGLGRLENGAWRRFTTADGLLNNFAHHLVPLSGKELWFTYRDFSGVTHFSLRDGRPEVRHFGKAQGLPTDTVYMVGADVQGRIWAGGNAGLSVISPKGEVRVIRRADGLIWDDINSYGFWAERDGSVFIGTSRGLAHYDSKRDEGADYAPSVVITAATLGGKARLLGQHVTVPWDERDLTVEFSGLSFRDPAALRFRYRLVGMHDKYLETAAREVRYQALPAGRYTFEVLCGYAGGAWSETPATFSFTVRPTWWASWWALTLWGLLLIAAVVVTVKLRTHKLQLDRQRLEAAVAERSTELDRANRELREMSYTDPLTRTRNRRYFSEVIGQEVARTLRHFDVRSPSREPRNRSLAFFMVDLDHFKRINDILGHLAGDRVLAEVGRRFRAVVREGDLVVRWGGEEFLIMSRDCEPGEMQSVAERLLAAVGEQPFQTDEEVFWRGTCSVGWAAFPWLEQDPKKLSYEQVIELADRALFVAKGEGRNQATGVAPQPEVDLDIDAEVWLQRDLTEEDSPLFQLTRLAGPTAEPGKRDR